MKFHMFAASIIGKKHLEPGLPCQDSSSTFESDRLQIIAVADGHGGKDYFRSETGSKLAVETVFEQVKIFCSELKDGERFSESGIKNFELSLWENWRNSVKKHWEENPVCEDETRWHGISEKYRERYTSEDEDVLEKYIPVAYGTTLIFAVSIGSQILICQLGDGTCVVLQKNGEFKVPVPSDSENNLNITTSICEDEGYKKFRHVVLDCSEDSPLNPVAIFLSTDGLDNCWAIYENEKHLYKFYDEVLLDSIINRGFDATEEELKSDVLPCLTTRGSYDDISLAYFVTKNLVSLGKSLGKEIPFLTGMKNLNFQMRKNIEKLNLCKVIEETQPQVKEQAIQVREKLLPIWNAEKRDNS